MIWNGGIQKYCMLNLFGYAVHDPSNDHAPIAMPCQDNIIQLLIDNGIYYIGNVRG